MTYRKKPSCGLCGSTEDLKGPYAGGPFAYYCELCKAIIDKYNEGHRELKKFWREKRAKRKKEKEGSATSTGKETKHQ